jgi:hypothetical protein
MNDHDHFQDLTRAGRISRENGRLRVTPKPYPVLPPPPPDKSDRAPTPIWVFALLGLALGLLALFNKAMVEYLRR